jgi:hypothetical protein
MRRQTSVLAVIVALIIVILPATAPAGGRARPSPGLHARTSLPARASFKAIPEFRPKGAFGSPGGYPFVERAQHGRFKAAFPGHHRFPPRAFVSWVPPAVWYTPSALYEPPSATPPPVVTVAPVIYASPTVYVSLPVASPQAATVPVVSSGEELTPRVVEHPTGRYELRGDGVATPYVWVWRPHPPAEPPAGPTSAAEQPRVGADRAARRTETYRWTDEEGTTFLTNRPERIPQSYRSQAQEPAS